MQAAVSVRTGYSRKSSTHDIIPCAIVLKQLVRESSLLPPDFRSFKRQEVTFLSANVCLLCVLLLTQLLFESHFGRPPRLLLFVILAGLAANAVELIWIDRRKSLSPESIVALTWASITVNMGIAFSLASLSYRQDVQYFTLMIAPIFQAAFRLSLVATLATLAAGNSLIFFWVWNYFRLHPPPDLNEYVEAGTIAAIYVFAGLLVWTLVNHLRLKQTELTQSFINLEEAKAKLLIEENLAAVGRLSSAIAHEIRNPVAMISSALATASDRSLDQAQRVEMFDIAAKEASRLERLTTDFLAYARPRTPSKERADVADSIGYIADVCRPRAAEKTVLIRAETELDLWANIDGGQLQQALLNLAMNAIEASAADSVVVLRGRRGNDRINIEVENSSSPIPAGVAACIFEPFFTTKPNGTGLGLAIAHRIVLGNDGDLVLSRNEPGLVRFTIVLPACAQPASSQKVNR
jgi:two-component system, NtrC family, sensor histidine kinase HydH